MPTQSFTDHLVNLTAVATSDGNAAATPGAAVRAWAVPIGYPVGTPLYDPDGLIAACDRTDLNDLVLDAYARGASGNDGRIGEIIAGKMALDHIACRERALQARHATPCRLRAWSASRRAGHGDSTYGVFGALAAQIGDAYAAATAVPNAQN